MKKSLAIFGMLFMMNSFANHQPTEAEIQKNRQCFQDLEIQGCRTQEEDQEQFRSCLSNSLDSLEDQCRKMMLDLYGDR